MSQFYHATTQRSTAVTKALTGKFTGPNDLNLVIVKNTFLEVYDVTNEGLQLVRDVPVNASILAAVFFRRKFRKRESLFILTKKAGIAIIECNRKNDIVEFTTVLSASIADSCVRTLDQGFDTIVDPMHQYILIRFYYGVLKLIPISKIMDRRVAISKYDFDTHAIDIRIDEKNVIDMVFLSSYASPTFALLYEEEKGVDIKIYDLCGKEPSLRSVSVTASLEETTKMIIPAPNPINGFLLVSDNIICFHTREVFHCSSYIPQSEVSRMVCWAMVDPRRYLLGDMGGSLYMVHLSPGDDQKSSSSSSQLSSRVDCIRIERLGEVSIPESIVYLDQGVVFIGSYLGDSQLIRLNSEAGSDKCYLTVLEQFTNLGPIVDMVFSEDDGQSQLITCSGCQKEGSLRIIRNGIGIQEMATVGQTRMKASWCFPITSSTHDDAIIISLAGRTRIRRVIDDDLRPMELEGFVLNEQTLHCDVVHVEGGGRKTPHSLLLQATSQGLRIVGIQHLVGKGCLATWRSPTGRSVSSLASRGDLVVVASGADVFALRITGNPQAPTFTQIGATKLPHEAACVDLSPFDRTLAKKVAQHSHFRSSAPGDSTFNDEDEEEEEEEPEAEAMDTGCSDGAGDRSRDLDNRTDVGPEFAAVGMWMGHGVALLRLPSLEIECSEPLPEMTPTGTAILPRSIAVAQFEGMVYLFVATGDGALFFFTIDCSLDKLVLRDMKRLSAGSGPHMRLTQWRSHGKRNIFVCSNRPCIIYSNRHKLVFANVNIKEVHFMSPFKGSYYTDCICMVTPSGLVIGSVDNLQKLHVRTVLLQESPRRLALQPEKGALGVITARRETFVESQGAFKPLRNSISVSAKVPKTRAEQPTAVPKNGEKSVDIESTALLIFNQANMELQHVHHFYVSQLLVEVAMSISSVKIGGVVMFAVGTALLVRGEHDPRRGRIHLIHWEPSTSSLQVVLVHDVHGAVFQLREFNNRLLAAVAGSVRLFELTGNLPGSGEKEGGEPTTAGSEKCNLRLDAIYNDNIMVLYLSTRGDYVLVGDLMRSLTLLVYKPNRSAFEVVGRNHCPRYTSGMAMIDDEHFIAGDTEGNLQVLARNLPCNTKEPEIPFFATPPSHISPEHPTATAATTSEGEAAGTSDPTAPIITSVTVETVSSQNGEPQPPMLVHRSGSGRVQCISASMDPNALVDCANFHIGGNINVFVIGAMNGLNSERWEAVSGRQSLYATVQGSLGLVARVSPVLFAFLRAVEERLADLLVPVGGFAQPAWRSSRDCLSSHRPPHNVLDGELLETFLDLAPDDKQRVVQGLRIPVSMESFGKEGVTTYEERLETKECSVHDLIRVIEEMASLH